MKLTSKTRYLFYATTFFFFYFTMGIFISILTIYLTDKGVSTSNTSYIISSTALFTIILQPILGYLSDKLRNSKLVVMIAIIIIIFTGVSIIFTDNIVLLFLLNGTCQALIIGIVPLLDNLALHSNYSYGSIRYWGSIGYAVSVQICSLIYDYISSTAVFIIFFIAGTFTIIGTIGVSNIKYTTIHKSKITTMEVFKCLTKNKSFIIFSIISFIILGLHYANIAYMPILIKTLGGSATNLGTILLLQTIFEIPVIMFSDKIINRFSYRTLLIFTSFIMMSRLLWYSTFPSITLITLMIFFQGLSTCLYFILMIKIINTIVEEKYVNTALAVASMVGKGIGALVFQLVGGIIISTDGIKSLYFYLGILGVICLIISFTFCQKKQDTINI